MFHLHLRASKDESVVFCISATRAFPLLFHIRRLVARLVAQTETEFLPDFGEVIVFDLEALSGDGTLNVFLVHVLIPQLLNAARGRRGFFICELASVTGKAPCCELTQEAFATAQVISELSGAR